MPEGRRFLNREAFQEARGGHLGQIREPRRQSPSRISVVSARPAEIGRPQCLFGQDLLDRGMTMPWPASVAPRCSSIIAAAQIWPTGLAIPFPAMSGRSRGRARNSDGYLPSGLMLPDGAIPIVPVQAGPRSERMSPKRFEATTTSNQSGMQHELGGQNVDVILVHLHIGILRFAISATRSSQ